MKTFIKTILLTFTLVQFTQAGRYYDSEMGRFIQRDAKGYVDGYSLYNAYFAENFALDPSGFTKDDSKSTKNNDSSTQKSRRKGSHIFVNSFHNKGDKQPYSVSNFGELLKEIAKQQKGCSCVKLLELKGHGGTNYGAAMDIGYDDADNDKKWDLNAAENLTATTMTTKNVDYVSETLKEKVNFCTPCYILLTSCNLGLTSLPQSIADKTGCKVFASDYLCRNSRSKGRIDGPVAVIEPVLDNKVPDDEQWKEYTKGKSNPTPIKKSRLDGIVNAAQNSK